MNPPSPSPAKEPILTAAEWGLTIALAAVIAWTTLCLGGFLARTMAVSGPAVLGIAALAAGLHAWRPVRLQAADWLPVPFLLFALASVLWLAPAKWLAWREWLLWLQMWLVFVLVRHRVRTPAQAALLAGTVVALAVAGAAMAAYQRYVDPKWLMLGRTQAGQFSTRSAGMFGIPNSLAALLELVLPVCLILPWRRSTGWGGRLLSGWLAALFLGALMLTGSRGGWISCGLALLLWPLLGARSWRRRLGGAFAMLGLVALVFSLLYRFSPAARERLDPFLAGQFELSRPIVWRGQLRIWRDQPWLGSGAASFNVLFEQVRPRGFLSEPRWTHNDYLNTLGDYGVAGFLLWLSAGAGLLALGWREVREVRADGGSSWLEDGGVRLGLWLGLLTFALHLAVDFHTKIPALAYLFAVSAGLLLHQAPQSSKGRNRSLHLGLATAAAVGLLALAGLKALPQYRAEAVREEARRRIDEHARTGMGSAQEVSAESLRGFRQAVVLDPENAQAWSDLAYATILSWDTAGTPIQESGRRALLAADRALKLCPVSPEFWVRRGVAQDMIPDKDGADASFRRAAALAPYNPEWLYYQAYHWASWPGHAEEARQALAACLSLDPNYPPAIHLRERIHALPR